MMAVKSILRYLKGIEDYGLWYKHGINLDLKVFIDADWVEVLMTEKVQVEEHFSLVKD